MQSSDHPDNRHHVPHQNLKKEGLGWCASNSCARRRPDVLKKCMHGGGFLRTLKSHYISHRLKSVLLSYHMWETWKSNLLINYPCFNLSTMYNTHTTENTVHIKVQWGDSPPKSWVATLETSHQENIARLGLDLLKPVGEPLHQTTPDRAVLPLLCSTYGLLEYHHLCSPHQITRLVSQNKGGDGADGAEVILWHWWTLPMRNSRPTSIFKSTLKNLSKVFCGNDESITILPNANLGARQMLSAQQRSLKQPEVCSTHLFRPAL